MWGGGTLVEFMEFGTMSVEFSFDKIMYRQIDKIFIGFLLGPVMTSIFVGFYEQDLLAHDENPVLFLLN